MRAANGGVENVDWPPELRVFKTIDTSHYVAATVASARVCATCRGTFAATDRRSLTVEVRVPTPPAPSPAFRYRQFAAEVHHHTCRLPELQVVRAALVDSSGDPLAGQSDMHYVLQLLPGPGGRPVPALVFTTTDPIVVRALERAEGRSAWVSTYLELGFELFGVADLDWILGHAPLVDSVTGRVDGALFSLTGVLDGRSVPLLELTRPVDHPAYRRWQDSVVHGRRLFVLYGEYVHVDPAAGTVDLSPGGRLGDVTGAFVPVDGGLGHRPG